MSTVHRLFFALWPSQRLRTRIGAVSDGLGALDHRVADDRLHLTLAMGCDSSRFPEAAAETMLALAERVDSSPISLRLERLAGTEHSLALQPRRRSTPLHALARALGEPLARCHLMRADWQFSPHVTLGYRKQTPFTRGIAPIGWDSADFVLIHSVVGREYRELGRWPLVSRQGDLFA
ncbi:2'-5' RNA ligase family protein [Sphingosinithalassobacter portus]|uniref:2'-5' RNA ligase family protein n=1 Tax=Stakelama portus TaxID=2676234 RepID=UPI000D6E2840|nr:2'-5' RNA ligase family protein [Sphingosinithalassobacter portus]